MALQLFKVCFEKRGHLILKTHFSHAAALVTQGHLISWDVTGSEDTSHSTYVLLRKALKMKMKIVMRARPARVPVLVPQTYRAAVGAICDFSTPCTTTKRTPTASKPEFENPPSASFIVMRPAFHRITMPAKRDVQRVVRRERGTDTADPTHDVDNDWDKLKQPTGEGDIGRGPILCHEEDKHHDQKYDNEPWLPV